MQQEVVVNVMVHGKLVKFQACHSVDRALRNTGTSTEFNSDFVKNDVVWLLERRTHTNEANIRYAFVHGA